MLGLGKNLSFDYYKDEEIIQIILMICLFGIQ